MEVDLTVPIDKENVMSEQYTGEGDCFGQDWDAGSNDCAECAVSEICCIMFKDKQDKKVKSMEKAKKYLDISDFSLIDRDALMVWLSLGKRTVDDVYEYVERKSKSADEVAIVEWIKRFIRDEETVYTKDGFVKFKK